MEFFSSTGQDRFVFETFFRGRRNGTFIEIGAAPDAATANTLSFEKFLDWTGIRIPAPSDTGQVAAALRQSGLTRVDFCSVHLAGQPPENLAAIDFSHLDAAVVAVSDGPGHELLQGLMTQRGYELAAHLGNDSIFRRHGVRALPRTTVICAVWHGDAERRELLQSHAANLASQTVPVEIVYVFDGADEVPESTPGRKLVAHENLTIYQAWNVALSVVDTPFVMNLNLDDRLAPDAVEQLESALLRTGAALVGGDWKACYSQHDTDAVERCYPADRLPFVADWPPRAGTLTRLGSGTGERGTYGPATLWRMDAHVGAPRYPWRFPDGTRIKVIGDLAWWTILMNHQKAGMTRLPLVIGHYHSRPGSQAEFRGPQDEGSLMSRLGLSLL